MPCYDDDSTNALAPSLIEVVNDDSSVDSLSSAGNATYLLSLENYQTEVDQPRYNYLGPKIVLPRMSHRSQKLMTPASPPRLWFHGFLD